MKITLSTQESGYIIKDMYPLHLHDLAGIYGKLPTTNLISW